MNQFPFKGQAGARNICWRIIESYSQDCYVRGLLHLTHKPMPTVLLKRCLISDSYLPESYFDRFQFVEFSMLKGKNITWKDIENIVYESINDPSLLWIPGSSKEGISLSLKLNHWNSLYQSFLERRRKANGH